MDNPTTGQPFEFSDYNQRIMVAMLILITSVVGTIGNSMMIVAVLLSETLRTSTIAFFVNMSVAHLLCSLVLPWDVVALLSTDDLPRGDREWLCSLTTVTISITIGCGIYTLASLAINHLLLIARPTTTYRKIFTPKKIAVWLIVTWLIPFLVILLPPLLNVGKVGFNEKFHLCGTKSSDPAGFKTYNFIRVFGLYPIPLVCIIVCYSYIWRRLCCDQSPSPSSGSSDINCQTRMINETMPFLIAAFLILLLPYAVCLFIKSFEPAVPFASAILFSSCCVNPIFYGIRHRDINNVYSCVLHRRWNDIPQPSSFLTSAVKRVKKQGKEPSGLHQE